MLKPQDILAILKVHSWDSTNWTYSSLAQSLGMSASEVHAALERSEAAGLYYGSERKILKQAVLEFLVHGLRYVFYAQPGPLSRGLPTAHSAEPLKSKLVASPSEVYVWPIRDKLRLCYICQSVIILKIVLFEEWKIRDLGSAGINMALRTLARAPKFPFFTPYLKKI
ncbi:hypothetical protein QUB47_34900 [Microcoleus sp. AT9_B5]